MKLYQSSIFFLCLAFHMTALGQENEQQDKAGENDAPVMTNERLEAIIARIDPEYEGEDGFWQFDVHDTRIQVITDTNADRMRISIPIRSVEEIKSEELFRMMQANFDSALDARYAIGRGILWSSYVHPLSSLNDRDFISGLGQTINTALSYGTSYSSGAFTFGGGDSGELLEKQLIEELLERGQVI